MKYFTLVIALLFTTPAYAYEEGDTWLGAHVGLSTIEVDDVDDIEHSYGLLRLGVYMTPSLTLEVRYGQGFDDDTVSGVEYTIERIAGIYAAYHFEIGSGSSIYGLFGYSEVDVRTEDSNGVSDDEDETDPSFGLGLNFGNINLEYIRYIDRSDYTADAISVGYNFHFD